LKRNNNWRKYLKIRKSTLKKIIAEIISEKKNIGSESITLKSIKDAVKESDKYTKAGEEHEFEVIENDGNVTKGALDRIKGSVLIVVDYEDYEEYAIPLYNIKDIVGW